MKNHKKTLHWLITVFLLLLIAACRPDRTPNHVLEARQPPAESFSAQWRQSIIATAEVRDAEIAAFDYYETFTTNQFGWREQDQEDNDFWWGSTHIDNGRYTWQVDAVHEVFISWSDFDLVEDLQDFDLALKGQRLAGAANYHCYGAIFRKSFDGFNAGAYVLTVCDEGFYKVAYYDSSQGWESIQHWTESATIRQDDWNLIEISARGDEFTVYINTQEVTSFRDDRLPSGLVSIMIDILEEAPGQIVFDFFALQPR